jgi:hypothetical protein
MYEGNDSLKLKVLFGNFITSHQGIAIPQSRVPFTINLRIAAKRNKEVTSQTYQHTNLMCQAVLVTHPGCMHRWLQLQRPCGYGMNLLTCPMFWCNSVTLMTNLPAFPTTTVPENDYCPQCHRLGHAREYIRIMRKSRRGVRFGMGPSKSHGPGVEIGWCNTM